MVRNFYLPDSDKNYLSELWHSGRQHLQDKSTTLLSLDKANRLNLQQFFTKDRQDIKPRLNPSYNYFAIPYELDDMVYQDLDALTIICDVLNPLMVGEPIVIASTDSDKCCVVKCDDLNEDSIYSVYNLNTPFIICSSQVSVFALIDFDLPLQIIGYAQGVVLNIKNEALIQQGFDTVFKRYASYTNMRNLLKTYYDFLLPKSFSI